MKGNSKTTPIYFSAYPLKAVQKEDSSLDQSLQSPYLRAILSGKTKAINRIRVFPMINPYSEKNAQPSIDKVLSRTVSKQVSHVPEDIELTEKKWFNNYE